MAKWLFSLFILNFTLYTDVMLCPECSHSLLPISIKNQTTTVILDYCSKCGSIWSDRGEVNFVQLDDLDQLTPFLPQVSREANRNHTLMCPADRNTLTYYRGENVPSTIEVFSCSICGGYWFPGGMLVAYKKAQYAKVDYFKLWEIPLQSIYSVLLPIFVLSIVTGSIALTVFISNQPQSGDTRIQAEELFGQPQAIVAEPGEVTVIFSTLEPMNTHIRYWVTQSQTYEEIVSNTPISFHSITLSTLEKNKKYSYQLIGKKTTGEIVNSKIFTFDTK